MINNVDTIKTAFIDIIDNEKYFSSEEKIILSLIIKSWYKGDNNKLIDYIRYFNFNKNTPITNLIKKMYSYQQKYFEDRNINTLKLYRGIGLRNKINKYETNKFESWTSDKSMAEDFSRSYWLKGYKNSGILMKTFNIKYILFSQKIYPDKNFNGDEYVCKSNNFNIDSTNFIIYTHRRKKVRK